MKLFKLKFGKREPKVGSVHKKFFNPNYFWALSLAVFVIVVLLGSLFGLKFFRSVYLEDYKNEAEVLTDINTSMNIDTLKQVVKKRDAAINKEVPISTDPSR